MTDLQQTRGRVENRLVDEILAYGDKNALSIEELAKKMDISMVYLLALIRGDQRIDSLAPRTYRVIAAALDMSCFSAMRLSGAVTDDDFIIRERDVVVSEQRLASEKRMAERKSRVAQVQ